MNVGKGLTESLFTRVLNELKNRGVKDIFISMVDELAGFEEAIKAVYPKTGVNTGQKLEKSD